MIYKIRVCFILVLLICAIASQGCLDCEDVYSISKSSSSDFEKCKGLANYLTCLDGGDGEGNSCFLNDVHAPLIERDFQYITNPVCDLSELCLCQKAYWSVFHNQTNGQDCSVAKERISCLRGKTGLSCDGVKTLSKLALLTEGLLNGFTDCVIDSDTACHCELEYIKADVSSGDSACSETEKFIGCLKGKPGNVCGETRVEEVALEALNNLESKNCDVSELCQCEVDYAKSDISTNTKWCTETKRFIHCLRGKTGLGCDEEKTAIQLAEEAETIAENIPGSVCMIDSDTACHCELEYIKADVSSGDSACSETEKFIGCLKGKPGNVCGETRVEEVALEALNKLESKNCDVSELCQCEVDYAKSDISTNTKWCTETKRFIHCLKGKTGLGCDEEKTAIQLAEEAETIAENIPGSVCMIDSDTACHCELEYIKADVSSGDSACRSIKIFIGCLRDKDDFGCDGASSVVHLITEAESMANKVPDNVCTFPMDSVCSCEVTFIKAGPPSCTTMNNFISCLISGQGFGCDGNKTVRMLALEIKAQMASLNCPLSPNCICEIELATSAVNTNDRKCRAAKSLTTCIQTSIETGCGEAMTRSRIGILAQEIITDIGSTDCPVTSACQCQLDFNMAEITNQKAVCEAATQVVTCLQAITTATEPGCNEMTLKEAIEANLTSLFLESFCSSGTEKSRVCFYWIFVIMAISLFKQR